MHQNTEQFSKMYKSVYKWMLYLKKGKRNRYLILKDNKGK